MARHHVPGRTVAVTDAHRLLFGKGFGHADLAASHPATADTAYLWFSRRHRRHAARRWTSSSLSGCRTAGATLISLSPGPGQVS